MRFINVVISEGSSSNLEYFSEFVESFCRMLFKKIDTINGNLLYKNPIYCVLKYKNMGFDKWQTHPSTVGGNLTGGNFQKKPSNSWYK